MKLFSSLSINNVVITFKTFIDTIYNAGFAKKRYAMISS